MLKIFLHIIIFFLSTHVFAETDDWTSYGKNSGGGHFSKASEITPENVKNLKKMQLVRILEQLRHCVNLQQKKIK